MLDPSVIDRLLAEITRHLPAGLDQARQEVERNVRAALQEGISRLDLVSREEFEVQSQVLARTREKLEALERQVTLLEQQRPH